MFERKLQQPLLENLKPGHVTALFGARRTGKTTLMQLIAAGLENKSVLLLNGEDYDTARLMASLRVENYKNLTAGYHFLFIDEAQNIPDIGKALKLIVDTQPHLAVFATGSSSFDLKNKIGEPLTGRSRFYSIYPLSFSETGLDYLSAIKSLPQILIYGTYPQVLLEDNLKEKRHLLESIRNGYLIKDVLQLDNLKDSHFIMNLLRQLAFQTGNDTSYSELASNLGTTVKTIKRYLDILEKAFVIFSLYGFSRNLRKEFNKSPRFYFWDNGVRNALISNFNPPEQRDDMGKLWENFCISERIKKQRYAETFSNFWFWRTYDQQEIDLIEEMDGQLFAWEFKWGNKQSKIPKSFAENYPTAHYQTINHESFPDFLK